MFIYPASWGYTAAQFHGLRHAEAMELCHVARNLSEGHGFTTRCVRPFDVWYLGQRTSKVELTRIADLHHPPAYPLLLSWIYRLVHPAFNPMRRGGCDAEYRAMLPLAIGLTALCALVLFRLGVRLFGPREAGVATLLYLVSNVTLGAMVSGLPIPLLSFAVTLSVGLALRAVQLSITGEHLLKMLVMILGSAACVALAVLTDYTMIAVAFGVLFLLAVQLQRLRWVSMLLFLLVCGGLVAPWLAHNQGRDIGLLGAKPYTAVSDTVLFPDDTLARTTAPEFNAYRVAYVIRRKVISSVSENLSGRGAMAGGIIVCFFIVALFHRYENPVISGLKGLTLITTVLLALLSPLVGGSYAVFSALFPLVVLLGTSAFLDYLDREEVFVQGLETFLTWAMVVACAIPTVAQVVGGSLGGYPPYYAPIQRFVSEMVKDDKLLFTDIPWATAWYGDRTSVLLPQTIADVEMLSGGWEHVGGIYLTTETANRAVRDAAPWRPLLHQQVPESIPLRSAIQLPAGTTDQLFLCDKARWETGGEGIE